MPTTSLGYSYRDIADYLVARGYKVYVSEWHPVERYGVAHEWKRLTPYPSKLANSDAWGNLLAFSSDPGEQEIKEAFVSCLKVEPSAVRGSPAPSAPIVLIPVMHKGSTRFERFYVWASTRSPNLVRWASGGVVRAHARRYPALTATYLALIVACSCGCIPVRRRAALCAASVGDGGSACGRGRPRRRDGLYRPAHQGGSS